jgi:hypothetical protein
MGERDIHENSKQAPPQNKEVLNMATPIKSTPVLKGKDLVNLANDLKRPDVNKARRNKALKFLLSVSKGDK